MIALKVKKLINLPLIAAVLSMTLIGPATTLAANPKASTISCDITQAGVSVKSDPNNVIFQTQAKRKGGDLLYTVKLKYAQKYIDSYNSYGDPVWKNNFKSFSWKATINGKVKDMIPLSDDPGSQSYTTTTENGYKYTNQTYNVIGGFYGLTNVNFDPVDTKIILDTAVSGKQTLNCNVIYEPPSAPSLTLVNSQITPSKSSIIQNTGSTPAVPAPATTTPGTTSSPSINLGNTQSGPSNTQPNPGNSTPDNSSSSTSSSSNSSSSNSSNSSSNSNTTSGVIETSSQDASTTEADLYPTPDILTCKARAKNLYFEFDEPAFDNIGVDCSLTQPALVNVQVYTKDYSVKSADNSGALVKTVLLDKYMQAKPFYTSWNGRDDYDQNAQLADYNMVITAQLAPTYRSDISIQKFTVVNAPGKGGVDETASAENVDTLKGAAPETSQPNVIESVANAIFGDKSATAEVNTNREASKCPGVYYPTDIEKSPYKDTIKAAYDRCLVKGYEDGTFKPDQSLSRAEAAKIIVLGTGNVAKQGCYDADCGSPFVDLETWQGPWIRSAYDLKMVVGVGMGQYAPNRQISRAEAVALVTKSFKIPAHQGCYTANCGAGYPDNFFKDIVHDWQGQYLRAAWDKKLITTIEPGKFYPDVPVSRAVFLDWTMKLVK